MAHYAKLGLDNVVEQIIFIETIKCMTNGGIEQESIGEEYLKKQHGDIIVKKCSYNTHANVHESGGTPLRANYPSVGWFYNTTHDIFHSPKPTDKDGDVCNSWTLNTTTGMWGAPITEPTRTAEQISEEKWDYMWDESLYQSDNTKGWLLIERTG